MQILDIVIYSHAGQRRTLPLRPGHLNVITGESRTGKSALLEIVRYCLGSEELRTPQGVISAKSAWFGLRLLLSAGQAFVGRPLPGQGHATTNAAMLRMGASVEIPSADELVVNTNTEALITTLGGAIGIEENEAVLPAVATRVPIQATLAHALFFCLQRQHEIANQDLLFHRQGEPYIPTHIRDVLPYFLGAVPANYLVLQARLGIARENLRAATDRLERLRAATAHQWDESLTLLREAQEVGLIAGRPWDDLDAAGLREALRQALDSTGPSLAAGSPGGDTFSILREQQNEIVGRYRQLHGTRRLAQSFLDEQGAYGSEFDRQVQRMEAVELLPADADGPLCPVCAQPLSEEIPTVAQLRSELAALRGDVEAVGRDEPRLRRLLARVEQDQAAARSRLQEIDDALGALARQHTQIQRLADAINEQSYVRGRIDHYLQALEASDESAVETAEAAVASLGREVEALEEEIGYDTVRENVTSILNVVGESMRAWAQDLGLEYSSSSVRIDLARLNVVADTAGGPVALTRMGSAANWVGYHLVAYLALQRFFVEHARPVPRFLMFDQPTQAFYPPDQPLGQPAPLTDADRAAVRRMFQLLHDAAAELAPGLQIIVTDHLLLTDQWFVDSIAQNWRDGEKLIPEDW